MANLGPEVAPRAPGPRAL